MEAVSTALLVLLTLVAAPKEEAKLKAKIASLFAEQARWCRERGLKEEALRALAEAKEADPAAEGVEALATEIEALEEAKEPPPEALLRRDRIRKEASGHYGKLAAIDHDDKEAARFEGYLIKSVELDPSKGNLGKLAALVKQNAGNKGRIESTGRMLVALRSLDAEGAAKGKYDALEADLAKGDLALLRGDHPMVGWISLPKGWTPKGEWPILVAVEGAGSNFVGAARGFASSRGSRNFIVLSPCSLSNTNELDAARYPFYSPSVLEEGGRNRIEFDLAGLASLLKVVRERYRGAARIGITGFSGGGNLCYGMTARNPGEILFAAPACPNFNSMGFSEAQPVEGGGPPVRIFTGEKDPHRDLTFGKTPPGIETQTDAAVEALKKLGFSNLVRTMLPGVGHSPCHAQVWAVADEALGK
jgi:predicted esterase